jgi:hypothetical protein
LGQAVIRRKIQGLLARVLLVGALLLPASSAMADSNPDFLFQSDVPAAFKYGARARSSRPLAVSFRRNEARAVAAPTRYRTHSILRYTRKLGDTGLVLRLKAPLKPRKLVAFEIRF